MSDGYLFVPLPDRVNRREHDAAVFDRHLLDALSGTINVRFICEQPVHIGAGFKRLHGPRIVRGAVRIRDGLGLPGSSLKGVLRSRFEAITYSCTDSPKDNKVWDVRSSTGITKARFRRGTLDLPAFGTCSPRDPKMCPACALFGRMSQRSRITVTDFAAATAEDFALFDLPEQFGPNIHHVGAAKIIEGPSRDRGTSEMFEVSSLKGRKFALGQGRRVEDAKLQPVEVIPAGTALDGQIRFQNVLPAELGGLLVAIGKEPASKLKIGGGKCYGLGRLRLHSASCHLRGQSAEVTELVEQSWRAAFTAASSDRFGIGEETLVRIHQGEC